MFALSHGEFAVVVFLFALVWGAGLLPRLGERLGARWLRRPDSPTIADSHSPRDEG